MPRNDPSEQRIFLSTLSDYRPGGNNTYYYFRDGKKRFYYSGTYSCEPDAKHVLSMYPIDRIVMLGSNQTYEQSDILNGERPLSEFLGRQPSRNEKALPFMARTIAAYLDTSASNNTAASTQIPQIGGSNVFSEEEADVLTQEAAELLQQKLPNVPQSGWFDAVARDHSARTAIMSLLSKRLSDRKQDEYETSIRTDPALLDQIRGILQKEDLPEDAWPEYVRGDSLQKQLDRMIQYHFEKNYLSAGEAEEELANLKQQTVPALTDFTSLPLSEGDRSYLSHLSPFEKFHPDHEVYDLINREMQELKQNRSVTLFGKQIYLSVRFEEVQRILRRIKRANRKESERFIAQQYQEMIRHTETEREAAARSDVSAELSSYAEQLRRDAEQMRSESEALIDQYRQLAEKLQQELSDIRTNRIQRAKSYIRQWLFDRMGDDLKAGPLEENRPETMPVRFIGFESDTPAAVSKVITDVVQAIRESVPAGSGVSLYIDMQGGVRTNGYILNSILSILSNDENDSIRIEGVFATNYLSQNFANEIVNETSRYKITDLVSGMNAFLQYGKADQIARYAEEQELPAGDPIRELIKAMQSIDQAVSLCSPSALKDSIKKLNTALDSQRSPNDSSRSVDHLFALLSRGIKRDYGTLIDPKMDENDIFMELIVWCLRKNLFQQALTIIETYLPNLLFSHRYLYYQDPDSNISKFREKGDAEIGLKENPLVSDPYYFVKNFVNAKSDYWSYQEASKDPQEKAGFFLHYIDPDHSRFLVKRSVLPGKEGKDREGKVIRIDKNGKPIENPRPSLQVKELRILVESVFKSDEALADLKKLLRTYFLICDCRNAVNHGRGRRYEDVEQYIRTVVDIWKRLEHISKQMET